MSERRLMRVIGNGGTNHPLSAAPGRTDAEQREDARQQWEATQARALVNLVPLARDEEDYLLIADMLGLLEMVPAEIRGKA